MAKTRGKTGKAGVAEGPSSRLPAPHDAPLANPALTLEHKSQFLALVRALARDAARADHAADED
ncbi:hypothetical protein GVY41_19805 [Frigidibacter albus]|uniref:Uncharacterized protein n=1 Tax=Frigidibacter albus TaxID=1465486 RepID=A0A6L8VM61_9RHOB|nr:hypothetical protein [Frigidibacter albus]MZQ91323.1 hypothetical protein [Frigidibacter albus]NBE33241.1 hypothetical protein [Frigidibacter albus]GGH64009.1 hypothetical protein GCM10011341_39640 [Frigidibacter albus]